MLGFAEQQVNVLRHHHVSDHDELIAAPNLFQNFKEQIAALRRSQPGLALVATAGDEMQLSSSVVTCGMSGHER